MKKILSLLACLLLCVAANAQSVKVVVNSKTGEVVGRYVRTNANYYIVEMQDEARVPKAGHKVVTYSAANGNGILYCKDWGAVNIRQLPNTSSPVIGKAIYEKGYVPETYPCLGLSNGWYKTEIGGRIGYVKANFMIWDVMDSF